jgi:hypothetical protein
VVRSFSSGEPEALAHAEREAADPPVGGVGEADLGEHLVDPARRQAGRGRQHPQVVAGGAAGVEAAGLQDRADHAGRRPQFPVGPAAEGGGAGGRGDQAEEHP